MLTVYVYAESKAHVLSFLKLGAFTNLHVLLRKRRTDTHGMQTQNVQV